MFYALTFLLLIIIPVLNGLMSSDGMDFDAAGARASGCPGATYFENTECLPASSCCPTEAPKSRQSVLTIHRPRPARTPGNF